MKRLELGLFWTLIDCFGCFTSGPTLFRRAGARGILAGNVMCAVLYRYSFSRLRIGYFYGACTRVVAAKGYCYR